MTAMKRAHEIRQASAAKWNCEVSEIIFSICLEMAWVEIKQEDDMKEIEIAEEVKRIIGNIKITEYTSEKQLQFANDCIKKAIGTVDFYIDMLDDEDVVESEDDALSSISTKLVGYHVKDWRKYLTCAGSDGDVYADSVIDTFKNF